MMVVTMQAIRDAIRALDLCGQPLCIHSSLRSFGWVNGGATTVIDGFLAEGCTVMVPTFTYDLAVPPPPEARPAQNGCRYDPFNEAARGLNRMFQPDGAEISQRDMGSIPAAVLKMADRVRGNHPLNSFAAVGPLAGTLIAGQRPQDVYAPFRALAEAGGSILLVGVGLDRMTLLHLAEQQAGRRLFIRWANGPDGRRQAVHVGSCSRGFPEFEPFLASLAKEHLVGKSRWRTFPVGGVLQTATDAIRANPNVTHCGDSFCLRCHDAVRGGPLP